jgi:hypothetical protein
VIVANKCRQWKDMICIGIWILDVGSGFTSWIDLNNLFKNRGFLMNSLDPILADLATKYLFSESGVWSPEARMATTSLVSIGIYAVARCLARHFRIPEADVQSVFLDIYAYAMGTPTPALAGAGIGAGAGTGTGTPAVGAGAGAGTGASSILGMLSGLSNMAGPGGMGPALMPLLGAFLGNKPSGGERQVYD